MAKASMLVLRENPTTRPISSALDALCAAVLDSAAFEDGKKPFPQYSNHEILAQNVLNAVTQGLFGQPSHFSVAALSIPLSIGADALAVLSKR